MGIPQLPRKREYRQNCPARDYNNEVSSDPGHRNQTKNEKRNHGKRCHATYPNVCHAHGETERGVLNGNWDADKPTCFLENILKRSVLLSMETAEPNNCITSTASVSHSRRSHNHAQKRK